MISIAQPVIGGEEKKAVAKVLDSGMLAQGPVTAGFEAAFAKFCGVKYAIAVNSGTAALHCALHAAGVGPGDEVITVPFTFMASLNPILMLGAKPVLVDIDPDTFNIDVRKVEAAITPKTKAILPIHLYGQPCDFDELQAIAKRHDLIIIEDACQAIGAEYKGQKAGSLGQSGCFSLYATKNIMSGEGGVVTTNDKDIDKAVRRFRQHGMDEQYDYAELGYNYRMTDVLAAIAHEQLKKADQFNQKRQKNAQLLSELLAGTKGVILPTTALDRTHVFHQYTVRISKGSQITRDELAKKLKAKGIGSGIYYPKPLHAFKHVAALGYKLGDFPISEQAAREVLSLPIHPGVSNQDIEFIAASIKEVANV